MSWDFAEKSICFRSASGSWLKCIEWILKIVKIFGGMQQVNKLDAQERMLALKKYPK